MVSSVRVRPTAKLRPALRRHVTPLDWTGRITRQGDGTVRMLPNEAAKLNLTRTRQTRARDIAETCPIRAFFTPSPDNLQPLRRATLRAVY